MKQTPFGAFGALFRIGNTWERIGLVCQTIDIFFKLQNTFCVIHKMNKCETGWGIYN